MGFVHLHVHTEYSLLDGACRIEQLAKAVKELDDSTIKAVVTLGQVTAGPVWNSAKDSLKSTNYVDVNTVKALTEKTTYMFIFQAPGTMEQSAVLAQTAAAVDASLKTLPENSLRGTETPGTKYNTFDYAGSVSVEKVSMKNGEASAWHVMITVTVTPTEATLTAAA